MACRMGISLVIWLIAIPSLATEPNEILDMRARHPGLFVAPPVPAWPQGLPRPLRTPADARCRDRKGRDLGKGAWLSQTRLEAIQSRLLVLDAYPGTCQARLNVFVSEIGAELEGVCTVVADGAVDVALADAAADQAQLDLERDAGHPTGLVIIWSTGSLAVGISVGVLLALAAAG